MRSCLVAVLACALGSGCVSMGRGEIGSHAVGKPKGDRCAQQQIRPQKACERDRDAAIEFARRLSVDDQVCLDGKQRIEEPMARCQVRAFVESTAPNGVKLEIREAPPSSKYGISSDWWFAEEALADIQLKALGYLVAEEIAADEK